MKALLRRLDRLDGWVALLEEGALNLLLAGLVAAGLALVIRQHGSEASAEGFAAALAIGGGAFLLGGLVLGLVTRRRGGRAILAGLLALLVAGALGLDTAVDHLARAAVLWIGLLGASLATRRRRHIAIEILDRFLDATGRRVAAVLTATVAAALLGGLVPVALEYVGDARSRGEVFVTLHASGFEIAAWWVKAVLPAALALMAWRFLLTALEAAFVGLPAPPTAESPGRAT